MRQSFWALGAALSFSIMAAFVKLCSPQLDPLEILFYRSLFAIVFILCFVRAKGDTVRTKHLGHHIARSVLGVASVGIWFFALRGMTFGTCIALTYTTPIFMAVNFIVLAFMRHRKAPWMLSASIAAGFAGILFVMRPTFASDEALPAALCLLVAAIDLLVYWQMKLMGRLNEPSWRIVFYFSVLGAALSMALTLLFGKFHAPDAFGVFGILGIGVFATTGQIFSTRAYAYGNMLLSACLGFSSIPMSAVIGLLVFDDEISAGAAAGMALIVAAGMAAAVITKRMERDGGYV